MSALTSHQRTRLALLARRAFNRRAAQLRGEHARPRASQPAPPPVAPSLPDDLDNLCLNGNAACFNTWRHEQVAQAVGKRGLRLCDQRDYKAVEARFLTLLGEDAAAFEAQYRAETEPRRQAEHNVIKACREFDYHIGYAAFLCRQILKTEMDGASPEILAKLRNLVITKGRARRRARAGAAPACGVAQEAT